MWRQRTQRGKCEKYDDRMEKAIWPREEGTEASQRAQLILGRRANSCFDSIGVQMTVNGVKLN